MENKNILSNLVNYIVNQGVLAIKTNTTENDFKIDYVAIFAKSEQEFSSLIEIVNKEGKEVDKETQQTGKTFLLMTPLETQAGKVWLIKIRKPDPTRPQRGAPDFKINHYQNFKEKYIQKSGNFTLMIRSQYEMIEIKGIDVLVYIPSQTVTERILK